MSVHLSSVTFDTENVCRANFMTISDENAPSLVSHKAEDPVDRVNRI